MLRAMEIRAGRIKPVPGKDVVAEVRQDVGRPA